MGLCLFCLFCFNCFVEAHGCSTCGLEMCFVLCWWFCSNCVLKGRTVTHITGYDAACVLALGSTLWATVGEPALVSVVFQGSRASQLKWIKPLVIRIVMMVVLVDSTTTRIITNRDEQRCDGRGIGWLGFTSGWDQLPQSSVPRIPRWGLWSAGTDLPQHRPMPDHWALQYASIHIAHCTTRCTDMPPSIWVCNCAWRCLISSSISACASMLSNLHTFQLSVRTDANQQGRGLLDWNLISNHHPFTDWKHNNHQCLKTVQLSSYLMFFLSWCFQTVATWRDRLFMKIICNIHFVVLPCFSHGVVNQK